MTSIQRFTPDYKMHAVRFEPFAREAEHGEYVRFDAHQQTVSALEAERDALADRVNALAVESKTLSDALSLISRCYKHSPHIQSMCVVETPATDAALAAIQAQGVEKALAVVSACRENICPGGLSENRQYEESIVQPHLDGIADELGNLIIELREAK
ncbi:hypothetical protein [Serratia marcescens]|uniref:hypothetical protein n=1 Tax=Serratia marcescens TaxID=615 RepID=UPI000744DE46|nr:hypothetical protein [Serratia marcescens]CUY18959.1 Uncharacterised protein [Serratia marcescens]CUY21506.1 Uncharacterised protein [Serratia marcescens]CUY68986.1 Uncharacterised protein [Serratia marcescens]CVE52444.1 Uncharacterised protein [Serratia marcescens]